MNFSGFDFDKNTVGMLNEADAASRFPHAVIIESQNSEKAMELAVFLSMYAVCESESKPCGECKQCKNAKAKSHADILYIKLLKDKKQYTIDQIRELTSDAYVIPNEGKAKVYVLEKADERLAPIPQNALLKLAEEPPRNVLFILTCKSAQTLLPTVLSRFTVIRLKSALQIDSETLGFAKEIAAGVLDIKEYRLLKALMCLSEKGQKERALQILEAFKLMLRDAAAMLCGGAILADEETARALAGRITSKKLLKMIDLCTDANIKIKQNVNINLLAVWLCGELRRITWQR